MPNTSSTSSIAEVCLMVDASVMVEDSGEADALSEGLSLSPASSSASLSDIPSADLS